ncbi:FAD-dependent oxidoreductase [Vallicoccus soli]|uniref:NAD(P)/FAD-dependent oxidoreductase n=1 Tax=Vallicoccus soli TaxID=2339232 RepID=A0A3A3ZL41_9ACTN|nr:FAD-dependent oxidoreductase [Vallicoccus soli]RJK96846.1 NAD(P)/FAD-dependent oxidoreductase [Vallicoccus soli]
MTRVVVVGNGMAGARLAQEVLARDPGGRVRLTVLGAEEHPAYNRVLLSDVVAGKVVLEDIALPRAEAPHVVVRTGTTVTALDRDRQVVVAGGEEVPYDVLVLATGSLPALPPVPGLRDPGGALAPGALAFRTVDDGRALLTASGAATRAVVLGGGLLGIEAARGLVARGVPVEVVQAAPHLMDRQLDPDAGRVLARSLADLGIGVRAGARAVEVLRGPDGRVRGVLLDDGATVEADLLVLSAGVRPCTALAEAAGLAVDRGVVVDDQLRSVTDPRVHALGECAQHDGRVYGLVAPAWEQAAVLAGVLTGTEPSARYTGSHEVTRLKASGLHVAAMGEALAGEHEAEVVRFHDPARRTYKKLVIRDDRLVGAVLLGDLATVGTLTQLLDRRDPVPADRLSLLFAGRAPAAPADDDPSHLPDRATVCRCNGVTKGAVTACWLAGARSTADVAARTRATTGCGGCRDTVDGLVAWLRAGDPESTDAAPATPARGVPA